MDGSRVSVARNFFARQIQIQHVQVIHHRHPQRWKSRVRCADSSREFEGPVREIRAVRPLVGGVAMPNGRSVTAMLSNLHAVPEFSYYK